MQTCEGGKCLCRLQSSGCSPSLLCLSQISASSVLLVPKKGFVVEIFAVHSGTLPVLAVCSFPPPVPPVHGDHATPTNWFGCNTLRGVGWWLLPTPYLLSWSVLTCEVLPTAPESRTKYKLQKRAKQEVLMLKQMVVGSGKFLGDGTFLTLLHVDYCSLGNKNPQGASSAPGTWRV